jgi:hypothetical protein
VKKTGGRRDEHAMVKGAKELGYLEGSSIMKSVSIGELENRQRRRKQGESMHRMKCFMIMIP